MDKESLIVIITYNSGDFIQECLQSLAGQTYRDWRLVMVDNGSRDDTIDKIRNLRNRTAAFDSQGLRLVRMRRNLGFARAVDHAVFDLQTDRKEAPGYRYLILLNPDISLFPDALERLVSTFKESAPAKMPPVGAAGGLILDYEKDIVQHMGGRVTGNLITYHEGAGRKYEDTGQQAEAEVAGADYVTGAFFATPYGLFCRSGGLDRGYRPLYFEELDYCLRLREAGWSIVSNPGAVCRHFEGASVKSFSRRFYRHYHKNRIRCAVINMDMTGILRIFIPAELKWLKDKATRDQTVPLLYAYLINTVFLLFNLSVRLKNHFILTRIELK